MEDFGGESDMSHLGLHLLKVRLDPPPRSTGPVSMSDSNVSAVEYGHW